MCIEQLQIILKPNYFSNQFIKKQNLSVCGGLTKLFNIVGHTMTVHPCSSGTFINMLPHRNVMQQAQGMTPHPVTVYSHRANLSLCYPMEVERHTGIHNYSF